MTQTCRAAAPPSRPERRKRAAEGNGASEATAARLQRGVAAWPRSSSPVTMTMPVALPIEPCRMSVHDASPHADLPWRVGFSHVPGIGPVRLAGLERDFGSLAQAWASPEPELALTLGPALARVVTQTRARVDVDRVMERLARHRITLLAPDMEHYPPLLRAIPAPPFLLYVQGNPAVLAGHAVAVVGTRNASAFGCATARTLAAGVAGAGGTVVSGMAVGIDAAAHRGALDGGGPTVAVLGCGLFVDHPAANRALRADVAGSGAVVSQFPPGPRRRRATSRPETGS